MRGRDAAAFDFALAFDAVLRFGEAVGAAVFPVSAEGVDSGTVRVARCGSAEVGLDSIRLVLEQMVQRAGVRGLP